MVSRADTERVNAGCLDGVRVRHQFGSNKLKMYDKEGLVLRVETVINDPRQFKVRRRQGGPGRPRQGESEVVKQGKGPLAWLPLRKSVAWLWKYAAVSFATNRRYLEALAIVDDPSAARALLGSGQPAANVRQEATAWRCSR